MPESDEKSKGLAENEFWCAIELKVPESERRRLVRWLNVQHTGQPEAPERPTEEHQDAAYALARCYRVQAARVRVLRDGTLELVSVEG